MIFQDPLSSLHPFYKVGWQLVEAMQAHRDISQGCRPGARRSSCSAWSASPIRASASTPIRTSSPGGMRQRAMIAMALVERAQAADRRRAHDRARRDRAGADPGADRAPPARARHGGCPDHARPRRGRRGHRRDRRDVRRQDRRGAPRRRSSAPRSIPTPGDCCSRSRGSTGRATSRWSRSRACRRA